MSEQPAPLFSITRPTGRLADYVRAVWTLDVPRELAADVEQPVVPDGCPELIFNLGDPIVRVRGAAHDVHVEPQVAGQMTGPVLLRLQGRLAIVGVRLHPWAMHAFLGVDAREMRDTIVPEALGVHPRLHAALACLEPDASLHAFAHGLTRALSSFAQQRPLPNQSATTVYRALQHLARGGPNATVRSVSRDLGRSERHLQRVFEDSVGLTPKLYLRLARMQRALAMAVKTPRQVLDSNRH